MDFHLVSGGGNHHDPADRVAGSVAVGASAGGVGVPRIPVRVLAVFHGLEPGKHDRLPRLTGLYRRRADSAGVHPHADQTPRTPSRQGHGDVRHDRYFRAFHRPDSGRLAD
ncbi:hypothetical protein D3C71_1501290 [compost metagenome]